MGTSAIHPFCLWLWRLVILPLGLYSEALASPASTFTTQQHALQFRCDKLTVDSSKHQHLCQGNVVLYQAGTWICCKQLTSTTDSKWNWLNFVCSEDVRLLQGEDLAWSLEGRYDFQNRQLHLAEALLLQKKQHFFFGQSIVFSQANQQAAITQPRGFLFQSKAVSPSLLASFTWAAQQAAFDKVVLPNSCPLPNRPQLTLEDP